MRFGVEALTAAVISLACSSRPEPQQPTTSDATPEAAEVVDRPATGPLELRFGWTSGHVAVVEESFKKGRNARMAYTLEITEVGDELHVGYSDFKFLAFADLDLDNPAVRTQIDNVEKQFGAMQLGFRVNREGAFVGLLDVAELLRGYEALLGPEEGAELREALANPTWRTMTEEAIARPWRTWVEVWLGLEIEPGETVEGDVDVEFAGASVTQHLRVTHLGPDPDRPGHVRLRYEARIDDSRFMESAASLTALVDVQDPAKLAQIREAGEQLVFLHERVFEVSIDPRTMMPGWAKSDMRTRIHSRDPEATDVSVDSRETHEWSFTVLDE